MYGRKFGTSLASQKRMLAEHFSGPSFLAWNRMGNLRGYAGPLPQSYIDDQAGAQGGCCVCVHAPLQMTWLALWRDSHADHCVGGEASI